MVLASDFDRIRGLVGDVPIRFNYNPSPTLNTITQQVHAYEELHGDFPELIVVDNALDVVMEGADADQSQSLDALMAWLHELARTTEACVVVLHHVTGPYNDANQPIPLSGVKGQIGRVPELILTLHKQLGEFGSPDLLNVSTVKNRGQKADPTGQSFVSLSFDGYVTHQSSDTVKVAGEHRVRSFRHVHPAKDSQSSRKLHERIRVSREVQARNLRAQRVRENERALAYARACCYQRELAAQEPCALGIKAFPYCGQRLPGRSLHRRALRQRQHKHPSILR